jgi:hypothetical protein
MLHKMKFWLTFGSGLVFGSFAGAFVVAFLLLDDVSQRPPSVAATPAAPAVVKVATIKPIAPKPVEPVEPAVEVKPVAVPAEAVDASTVMEEDTKVISSISREDVPTPAPTSIQ